MTESSEFNGDIEGDVAHADQGGRARQEGLQATVNALAAPLPAPPPPPVAGAVYQHPEGGCQFCGRPEHPTSQHRSVQLDEVICDPCWQGECRDWGVRACKRGNCPCKHGAP